MLCKRCMTIMGTGTTYEQKNNQKKLMARRFHECKKCKDKIYTNEPNFQECMNKAAVKHKNK